MDDRLFADVTRAMAGAMTRRGVVGRVVLGFAIAAGLTPPDSPVEARRKRRRNKARRRKARGRGTGAGSGNGATYGYGAGNGAGNGNGQVRIALCHWDASAQAYMRITVGISGAEAHLRQHDADFSPPDGGCCNAAECAARECNTVSCDQGQCTYALTDVDGDLTCGDDGESVCVLAADGSGQCVSGGLGDHICCREPLNCPNTC